MSNIVWEDFEKDSYGVARGGLSGQYGDMAPELHLNKMEQTCMYEREDQLDDYFRSTLKDRTTDAPSLAQDLPRETQNQVRTDVLNLRHAGARTSAEPIHPDLFLGFTDRDTRGYHNAGPDFKQSVDQSRARAKFIDFVSDHASDWTVPESHKSELGRIRDLRKTIGASKERLKIFDTSMDGRATTYNFKVANTSRVPQTTPDGTILDLNDAQAPGQRRDITKKKEDLMKLGYRTVPSNRFAVAQYGLLTAKQHKANLYSTRNESKVTQKYDVSPAELKNRLMLSMVDEIGRRDYINQYKLEMDPRFDSSISAKNNISQIIKDMYKLQLSTVQTADTIDGTNLGKNIQKIRVFNPVTHDMVLIDKDMYDKLIENKNISFSTKVNNNASRRNVNIKEGITSLPGDEVNTHVYSRKQQYAIKPLETKMEHNWDDSGYTPMYKNNHSKQQMVSSFSTQQNHSIDPSTDRTFHSSKKGGGQHWGIREDIDKDDVFGDAYVNDITTTDPSHRQMTGRSKRRR
jgi:hypothetical protein